VDLCQHHLERAEKWLRWGRDVEDRREATRAMREADKEYRQAAAQSAALREKIDAEYSVVYFIRRVSDGAIKIGTSGSFERRMATHKAEHGEMQILLTQSGNRKLEQEMHAMFGEIRLNRSEWFAPLHSLLWWIYQQRQASQYRGSQMAGALKITELRRLVDAAPGVDDITWRYGRPVWPPAKAA
jgi:hypothetical protein